MSESEARLKGVPWGARVGLEEVLGPAIGRVLDGEAAERVLDQVLRAHRERKGLALTPTLSPTGRGGSSGFSAEQRQVCAEALFGVGLWRRRLRFHRPNGTPLELLEVLADLPPEAPGDWKDRFSFPDWIGAHVERRFGTAAAHFADVVNRPGPITLRARGDRDHLAQRLRDAGIETRPGVVTEHSLIVTTPRPNLLGLGPDFLGAFEVQDEGSQRLGELVDVHEGDEVLDLCAGAGGKSLQLASLVGPQGRVHATDIDLPRLERLRTRASKANARVLIHGKSAPATLKVPRVLIDAPCSELGTLRRGPDLRWRIDPSIVEQMAIVQRELISTGLQHVSPGGRLIYATCTFTFEENEEVVERALNDHPSLRLIDQQLLAPHTHGTDGFFAAVFTATE